MAASCSGNDPAHRAARASSSVSVASIRADQASNSGRASSIASSIDSVAVPSIGRVATMPSAVVRSGCCTANAAAYAPPTDMPSAATSPIPSRSSAAAASSATEAWVEAARLERP